MFYKSLPLLATVVVIAVNAAANIVPINGYNTGQLSDLYPTGFTPPGYVFGIWSLIYLGLIAFGIAALRGGPALQARIADIRVPFLVNAAGNAAWIFVWHYRQVALSVAVMLVILATLVLIFVRLRRQPSPTVTQFLTVDGPFSLYFGWITAATLVNVGTLCFDWQRYPFELSMDQWALATVTAAAAIYVWMVTLTRDAVYGAVFVWAAIGIFVNPEGVTNPVQVAALSGAVATALCIAWAMWQRAVNGQSRTAGSAPSI